MAREKKRNQGKERILCAITGDLSVALTRCLGTCYTIGLSLLDLDGLKSGSYAKASFVVDGVHAELVFVDVNSSPAFAGRADLTLVSFSVKSKRSLDACKEIWLPIALEASPGTTMYLVGCEKPLRTEEPQPGRLYRCRSALDQVSEFEVSFYSQLPLNMLCSLSFVC